MPQSQYLTLHDRVFLALKKTYYQTVRDNELQVRSDPAQ